MRMKFRTVILLLALASVGEGICSDSVSCKIRTLGIGVSEMSLRVVTSRKALELPVTPDVQSRGASYSGPSLAIVEKVPSGERFEATLPHGADRVLLLVIGTLKGPTSVRVLDQTASQVPVGSTQFVNCTTATLGVHIGGEQFDLPPSGTKCVKPSSTPAKTQFVQVLRDGANGKDVVFSSNWAANASACTLVVIQEDADGGAFRVKRIVEEAPPAKR